MVEAGAPCWKKNDMLQGGAREKNYMIVYFKPELGEKLASEKNDMVEPGGPVNIGSYRPSSGRLVGAQSGPVAPATGDRYLSPVAGATGTYSHWLARLTNPIARNWGDWCYFCNFLTGAVIFVITVS